MCDVRCTSAVGPYVVRSLEARPGASAAVEHYTVTVTKVGANTGGASVHQRAHSHAKVLVPWAGVMAQALLHSGSITKPTFVFVQLL